MTRSTVLHLTAILNRQTNNIHFTWKRTVNPRPFLLLYIYNNDIIELNFRL